MERRDALVMACTALSHGAGCTGEMCKECPLREDRSWKGAVAAYELMVGAKGWNGEYLFDQEFTAAMRSALTLVHAACGRKIDLAVLA